MYGSLSNAATQIRTYVHTVLIMGVDKRRLPIVFFNSWPCSFSLHTAGRDKRGTQHATTRAWIFPGRFQRILTKFDETPPALPEPNEATIVDITKTRRKQYPRRGYHTLVSSVLSRPKNDLQRSGPVATDRSHKNATTGVYLGWSHPAANLLPLCFETSTTTKSMIRHGRVRLSSTPASEHYSKSQGRCLHYGKGVVVGGKSHSFVLTVTPAAEGCQLLYVPPVEGATIVVA